MSTRRGLGKGLGALIPSATGKSAAPETAEATETVEEPVAPVATETPTRLTYQDSASSDTAEAAEARNGGNGEHDKHERDHRVPQAPNQRDQGDQGDHQEEQQEEQQPRPAEGDPAAVQGASLAEVPVEQIRTNPRQPRQVFDEDALAELTHSIKEVGLLQPVVVRRQSDDEDGYLLIMGERRLRAAKDAGLEAIPAIVRETTDDDLLRDALLENLHRVQLNPLEEAAAYGQLLEDFGCTHDELAERIGRSRPQITNTIRLLKLPPPIQRRVAAGVLSAGHARALLMVSEEARQEHLAHRVVAEGLSVRALEELVALDDQSDKKQQKKAAAPKPVAPKVVDLQDRLSDRFETRVKVDLGRSKGKITVEFASVDDLERIVALMDPKTD